ncbi:hypothetical protein RvY_18923-2 [Ramazzottius varieornatus]|uniref:EF-hand domain-containing protein n=1 Tax=Ramazzottius varieornatus TaxID=947166 RepID=A0A1D1W7K4_RAMVA|nr:hypothetical protein RvY_18923-2 [Ramazzottius varieornatus]
MGNSSSKKSHVSKGDKLSKSDLDFLRANTNFDETTIREWHTGFHRDCPNGKLSPEKFVEVYKVFFPSGNASLFCEHVFRTFDQDKSGYIDFKVCIVLHIGLKPQSDCRFSEGRRAQ